MSEPATKREWLVWYLTNQIRAGELKPGQKLPSVAQMQVDYKISREGIWWAKLQLRNSGLIYSRAGGAGDKGGSFVEEMAPYLI